MVKRDAPRTEKHKRRHSLTLKLNSYEQEALDKYMKKYKVGNKAKFIRETIMTAVLKKFDEDYPSLFDQDTENK